jgi:hypothetical protein
MTIFKIHNDENYSLLYPDFKKISVKTSDRKAFNHALFSHESFGDLWVELEGIVEGNKPLGDISYISGSGIVLSSAAYVVLGSVISSYGECHSVVHGGELYQLFRCMNRIDVDNSLCETNDYDDVIKLGFHANSVQDQVVWVTEFDKYNGLFCGDKLREIINCAGLTGLRYGEALEPYSKPTI